MKHILALLIAGCFFHTSLCQHKRAIFVKEFMDVVLTHPDIHQSQEKINEAERDIEIARLSPDPSLTFGNVSGDISGINMPHQFFVGIDYTIETAGKRRHRVAQAKASQEVLRAEHGVFVDEFVRDALLTYQNCWLLKSRLKESQYYDSIVKSKIASDPIALEIMKIENELRHQEVEDEYTKELNRLQDLVSHQWEEDTIVPGQPVWGEQLSGSVTNVEKHPMLQLVVAEQKLKREEVLLAEADRIGDISFTIGNNFITEATNPEAPSPNYNAITATVSIPLRLSAFQRVSKIRPAMLVNDGAHIETASLEEIKSRFSTVQKENQRLLEQVRQIQTLIGLELKYISTSTEVSTLIDQLQKLHTLQDLRWKKMHQFSINQSRFGNIHQQEVRNELAASPTSK